MGHTSYEELAKKIEEAKTEVEVGATYYHYKSADNHYKVIGLGLDEATEEVQVEYQRVSNPHLTWHRNLYGEKGWLTQEEVDGKLTPRFQKVETTS